MKRPDFGPMKEKDYHVITGNGVLTDEHIMMAENILHSQFPVIDGFLSTALGKVNQFPPMQSEFIQILHSGNFHWVCVSNIGKKKANVNLYDSLYHTVKIDVKKQIASLLLSPERKIAIEVKDVQQQTNNTDCGVFAIAYATALCFGHDPCYLHFNRREIRLHLWKCFMDQKFTMFPFTARNPAKNCKLVSFEIYCICRQPWDPDSQIRMVQCENCSIWFHETCQEIPNAFFRSCKFKKWQCHNCKA